MDKDLYICEKAEECKKVGACDHQTLHKKFDNCEADCSGTNVKCIRQSQEKKTKYEMMEK